MGRGKCTFKQRDLKAALKAVSQSGAKAARVEVKPDGTIVVILGEPPSTVAAIGDEECWELKKPLR
jgi:hypothetical protein